MAIRRPALLLLAALGAGVATRAPAQWLHSFSGIGTQNEPTVAATPDGGSVFVSNRIDHGPNGIDPWVVKLDAAGQIEWQVVAPAPAYSEGKDVVVLADGSVAVLTAGSRGTLLLLDRDGAEQWHVDLPTTVPGGSRFVNDLAPAPDGGFLLVGIDDGSGLGDTFIWAAKLDAAGSQTWQRQLPFTFTSWGSDDRARIVGHVDGGVVVTSGHGDVARLGPTGTLLWWWSFADCQVMDAALLSDESVVVAFRSFDLTTFDTVAVLARFALDGTIEWHLELDGPGYVMVQAVAATTSDELVLVGTQGPDGGPFAQWMGTLAASGTLTSQRSLDLGDDWIAAVAARPDGSVLLGGGGYPNDPWIAHVPAGGLAPACATEGPTAFSLIAAASPPSSRAGAATDRPSLTPLRPLSIVPASAVVEATCPASGCRADAHEPDTGCRQVGLSLAPGESATLNFCDDPEDWLALQACAGQRLLVETSTLGLAADTVLELWAPDCTSLLASDDDGGLQPRSSLLDWTAPADGTYRVRIRQADATTGADRDYVVSLQGAPCGPATWIRRYAGAGAAFLEAATEAPGGTIVAAGRVTNPDTARTTWVLDATLGGDVLARTEQGGGVQGMAADFVRLPDGSRVVAGRIVDDSTPLAFAGWIARYDATGFPLWSRSFSGLDGNVQFNAIHATSTGQLLAAGFMTVEFVPRAVLVALDMDGQVLWQRRIADDTRDTFIATTFRDVTELAGGGIVAAGYSGPFTTRLTWLVGLDAAGNTAWQWTLAGGVTFSGEQRALLPRPDGSVLLAAVAGAGGLTFPAWLAAVEPDGDVAWQRGLDPGSAAQELSLRSAPDGGILLGAGSNQLFGDSSVHRFSPAGELEWSRRILEDGNVRDVLPTSDGGILLVGAAGTGVTPQSAWLAKLDGLGRAPSGCTKVLPFVTYTVDQGVGTVPTTWPSVAAGLAVRDLLVRATAFPTEVDEGCAESATCLPLSVDLGVPATACTVLATRLAAGGIGVGPFTYEWDLDWDGVTFDVDATGPRTSQLYAAGTYEVAVRVTDGCAPVPGQVIASGTVVVSPPTPPTISGPTRRCTADPCTLLEAPPGHATYEWSTGEITTSICVSPPTARSYTVTVTDDSGCPVTSFSHSLAVDRSPQAVIVFSCRAGVSSLEAIPIQGREPFTFAWSGGETTPSVMVGAGTWDVTVTDATGCTVRLQQVVTGTECADLREVSGPGGPPLRVTREGALERIRFEELPNVPLYDLHVGPIGSWLSSAAASGRECWIDTWTDEGDGTLSIARPIPVGSWILVTASSSLGEGPAGARSDGDERSLVPLWEPCGPP